MSDEATGHWWITTGVETMNGRKVMGPFDTRDLALEVRQYREAYERRDDYWVERLVPGDHRSAKIATERVVSRMLSDFRETVAD